jgi:hypothetical protein
VDIILDHNLTLSYFFLSFYYAFATLFHHIDAFFTTLSSCCHYASTLPFSHYAFTTLFYPAIFQCKVPWKPALNTTAPMLFFSLPSPFAMLCTTLLLHCHYHTTQSCATLFATLSPFRLRSTRSQQCRVRMNRP